MFFKKNRFLTQSFQLLKKYHKILNFEGPYVSLYENDTLPIQKIVYLYYIFRS